MLTERSGRLSTINLLIKVTCLVKKAYNIILSIENRIELKRIV
jgi:hypothetical protein